MKNIVSTIQVAVAAALLVLVGFPAFSQPATPFKVAAIEFNPAFKQREQNFPAIEAAVKEAADNQAKLVLFPEMGTTGYLYGSREEIAPFVDTIPGKTSQFLADVAKKYNVYIVAGMPEVDPVTDMYYNAAVFVGPDGLIGKYRKNNLFLLESAWAAQGDLGSPVFDTPLGRISIVICYDDYYYQSVRLAALKGADLIAFIASSGRMLDPDPAMAGVHISISDVQQQAAMNGVFVVATNRTNIERNDTLGIGVHYLGGASIWNPLGKNLAQAPVSTQKGQALRDEKTNILYGEIDPQLYDNANKALLSRRRPELYRDIVLNMSPRPMLASTRSHTVDAILVQYAPKSGDLAANTARIDELLQHSATLATNLIVFPELSLTGPAPSAEQGRSLANLQPDIDAYFASVARHYDSYVVYSAVAKENDTFSKLATLLAPNGEIVGRYRKTHLNEAESEWLAPGDSLPVFKTDIGRIGMLIGDDALFPEAADVLAVKRADIIAVSAAWTGQYGMADGLDKGFLVKPYPANTNLIWYATAKITQSYLLAANFTGTSAKYLGSSGLYSLDPVNGYYPPIVAPQDSEEGLTVNFQTIAPSTWWTSQQYIIDGRRPELYVPLVLDQTGACFQSWQASESFFDPCWR
jgi:predicted amidohydrolase